MFTANSFFEHRRPFCGLRFSCQQLIWSRTEQNTAQNFPQNEVALVAVKNSSFRNIYLGTAYCILLSRIPYINLLDNVNNAVLNGLGNNDGKGKLKVFGKGYGLQALMYIDQFRKDSLLVYVLKVFGNFGEPVWCCQQFSKCLKNASDRLLSGNSPRRLASR